MIDFSKNEKQKKISITGKFFKNSKVFNCAKLDSTRTGIKPINQIGWFFLTASHNPSWRLHLCVESQEYNMLLKGTCFLHQHANNSLIS